MDVSHRAGQRRVRRPSSLRVSGRPRRFSNTLSLHWCRRHQTTIDFFTAMNAEHHRLALPCLKARQPKPVSPASDALRELAVQIRD